ncbi:MAG TPA: hypothetical protein VGK74_19125 [Symbiobacteriaceae bacterium]|jgi:hypothetical protein
MVERRSIRLPDARYWLFTDARYRQHWYGCVGGGRVIVGDGPVMPGESMSPYVTIHRGDLPASDEAAREAKLLLLEAGYSLLTSSERVVVLVWTDGGPPPLIRSRPDSPPSSSGDRRAVAFSPSLTDGETP